MKPRLKERSPSDGVIHSPVKYWKAQHLIDKEFLGGFAFNRRHFHTNIDACILCAWWGQKDAKTESFCVGAYDIDKGGNLINEGDLKVSKVHSTFSQKFYDKRGFPDDIADGIVAEFDGTEAGENRTSRRLSPVFNDNILGYLVVKGANFDNPDSCVHLLTVGAYDGNGFYLRRDNYLEKLPMFCVSRYITYNRAWTERGRIMKSADGADRYNADIKNGKLSQFLLKCLLFACVEMQNHMRTFTGSDGRFYRNELCLDGTNGETIAMRDIKNLAFNDREKSIVKQWDTVLSLAKKTEKYNPALTYGTYQIFAELDTSHPDETTGVTVWDNVELHTALTGLKTLVKDYYNAEIVPVLFEYEFLK